MFGWYTPVFRAMYEVMPGVKLFRRPADATFVFGALIADPGGLPGASLADRADTEAAAAPHRGLVASRPSSWPSRSGSPRPRSASRRPGSRSSPGSAFVAAGVAILALARDGWRARRDARCSRAFTTADLAFNNAPHEFDRPAARGLRGAAPRHAERDRRADPAAPRRATAEPSRPRRADRHRLSLAEHLHDPRLRACVRAQSAAAEGVLRGDQGRRHGRGAGAAAVLAALSVLSLDLRGPVRPAPDRDRRAGRADRQDAQARRPEFRRAHQGRLRLREPARAAARA